LTTFRAVFIRAPAILESGPEVEILAQYTLNASEKEATGKDAVTVAVRSAHLMATAFHPELTDDARWHALFVDMVRDNVKSLGINSNEEEEEGDGTNGIGRVPTRPADLPVYH
jgi:5'-phosphate synthase pdxT subunit